MEFDKYLTDNKISVAEAAKALKKTRQHIWEIRKKKAFPGYRLMQAIDEWSNHKVSFVDFRRE